VRREVPDVRRAGPREELKIPKDLSELNGCWESQSGELLVVDARTNKRVGTSRNCYCFRKDGTGVAPILYTSQRNAARARGQKVCQGSMTASVRGDQLTFYHQAHLPCTDGSTFGPSGPADCKADQRVPQLVDAASWAGAADSERRPLLRCEACGRKRRAMRAAGGEQSHRRDFTNTLKAGANTASPASMAYCASRITWSRQDWRVSALDLRIGRSPCRPPAHSRRLGRGRTSATAWHRSMGRSDGLSA